MTDTKAFPADIMKAAREAHAAFATSSDKRNLSEIIAAALTAERERPNQLLAALEEIAKPTRGDDYNNPDDVRAAYYSSRFFGAQKVARDAIKAFRASTPTNEGE